MTKTALDKSHFAKAGARLRRSGSATLGQLLRWCTANSLTKRQREWAVSGWQAERSLEDPNWGGSWARYGRPYGRP
jgi:hypothetical protein